MTYKDMIFELFITAQLLFAAGQLYAANTLFCVCFELLETANSTGRAREINRVMLELEDCMNSDEAHAAFEEINKATGKFNDFEECKNFFCTRMKAEIVKPNFGKVPFAKMRTQIDKNWKVYNQTKHGRGQAETGSLDLDTVMPIMLSPEDVEQIERCVRGAIAMQYPDDVKKYLGM